MLRVLSTPPEPTANTKTPPHHTRSLQTYSSIMKIISLNTHGLSNFIKFRRLLTKLRIYKPDIILLQETFIHSIHPSQLTSYSSQWQSIWKGDIHLSTHLAILIALHISSQHLRTSPCHRIMDVSISPPNSTPLTIRNIYGPVHQSQQPAFWDSLPPLLPN